MKRRCLFLHHILQQDENSLLFRFFLSQMKHPKQGDWVSQVLNDLINLDIHEDLEQIGKMKKNKYSSILHDKIQGASFNWLLNKKKLRTSENAKGKKLTYKSLNMAEYLVPDSDLSIEEKKWHFKCRVEDINVKANRRWQFDNISCSSCETNSDETQSHILECIPLVGQSEILTYIPNYEELFNDDDLEAQVYVSRLIKDNHRRIRQ